MTRISTTWTGTDEGSIECPAQFGIEGEEYPAEPFSWGGSRGMEIEVSAELLSAQFGGLALTRDMVAAITGKDHVASQEDLIADEVAEAFLPGDAA